MNSQKEIKEYLRQGQSEEAISLLDQEIANNPEDWELWNERSVILESLGMFEQALTGYDQILQSQPQSSQAWYNRGNVLMQTNQLEAAISSYDQALSISPQLVDALNNRAIAQEKMADYEGAISTIDQAIALQPSKAEFHFNRGIWLSQLQSDHLLVNAIESLDRALAIRPGYGEAWHRRGNILQQQQRDQEAITNYRQALAVQPHNYEAANDLGILLEKKGDLDQARQSYEKAIALQPQLYSAWYNLGNTWQKLDCHLEAIKCYENAIEFNPEFADAHCNLGVSFDREQRLEKAIDCYKKALLLRPDFVEAERNLKSTYQKLVPRWHFVMLNDIDRNSKYDQALRNIINSDSIVLDIGAGSGLLAMMAARAGAKQVITCEMVPAIAEMATEIVAQNGFSEQISVIAKKSTNLEIGIDLPERANVLVTETFDVGLLGEEALSSLRHAIEHLVTPDAIILPSHATVFAQLIQSEQLYQEDFVTKAADFDVSMFNRFALTPNYLQRQLNQYQYLNLSEVCEVFQFDFNQVCDRGEQKSLGFPIVENGIVHAVVFWFELWLDQQIKISTSPETTYTHWQQAIQLLEKPLSVNQGEILSLTANHDCSHIRFVI